MPTLEQVSRRVFADASWFVKSMVGTFLLIVPGLHFFAFGYVYRFALFGRRGEVGDMPEWNDWQELFIDGLRCFAIVIVLAGVPMIIGWLASLPHNPVLGPGSYHPMVPPLVLGAPLAAAGIYRFQRREEFRDAFRVPVLFQMIVSARRQILVPTLAFIGFLFVLSPLLPYALFTGGVVIFYYYALAFHQMEAAARGAASERSAVRR
jgi:hypothetical protein